MKICHVSKATEVYANDLSGVTLLWKYENFKMCAIPRLWATVFVTISIAINWLQFSDRLAFHRSHDSKITTTTTTIQLQLRLLFVCLFIDPHQETFFVTREVQFQKDNTTVWTINCTLQSALMDAAELVKIRTGTNFIFMFYI